MTTQNSPHSERESDSALRAAALSRDTTPASAGERDPLLDFVAGVTGSDVLQVEEDLGAGFVRLNTAEAERRQARHDIRHVEDIIIEMLRNSRDAGARHIFVSSTKVDKLRLLNIIDDGEGVPDRLANRIFEARVTSKLTSILEDEWGVHGRGMALYSITQNTSKLALCASGTGLGAAFSLEVDTDELKERADQSTWPKIERDDEGGLHCVSGPKNLLRHISEFALMHPKLKVYVGSPNEILATLKAHGEERINVHRNDSDTQAEIPHCLRPAEVDDPALLVDCARNLGLELSTRSAYRIDSGEIAALSDVYTSLTKNLPKETHDVDLTQDMRGLKIEKQDLNSFAGEVERAFDALAEKYYISCNDDPKVSIKKNTITIKLNFEKEY
ncbi:MAG: ATP-binding protein [Coriobacteriia bacterium]|nr:ATP-binding protein [Coriobacteriia bacterium]